MAKWKVAITFAREIDFVSKMSLYHITCSGYAAMCGRFLVQDIHILQVFFCLLSVFPYIN